MSNTVIVLVITVSIVVAMGYSLKKYGDTAALSGFALVCMSIIAASAIVAAMLDKTEAAKRGRD